MATDLRAGLLVGAILTLCGGCLEPEGILYTRTTVPYSEPNGQRVAMVPKTCRVDITQLKEPFTQANLSVMWTDRVVADEMRRVGMRECRYADLETFSLLNRIYERRRIVFYGE